MWFLLVLVVLGRERGVGWNGLGGGWDAAEGEGERGGGECRGREREIGEKKTYQRRSHQ